MITLGSNSFAAGLLLAAIVSASNWADAQVEHSPWFAMDYGPAVTATLQIGDDHFANKGVAVRVDGGEANGRGFAGGADFIVFDTDTLRCAAGWRGAGGIDWRGWVFDGDRAALPAIVGNLLFENLDAPGWGAAGATTFPDTRLVGRDGRPYGPLDSAQGRWKGQYRHGNNIVFSYQVLGADVLESPTVAEIDGAPLLMRRFEIGPRSEDMLLNVAHDGSATAQVHGNESPSATSQVVTFKSPGIRGVPNAPVDSIAEDQLGEEFDEDELLDFEGDSSLRIAKRGDFDLTNEDFTFVARIRTEDGGTIFSQAPENGEYAPNSKSLFVDDGVLQFDVGWVGTVDSEREVDDGRWRLVAAVYSAETGEVQLFVDGKRDESAELKPTDDVEDATVLRIGFTTPDFPDNVRGFEGNISHAAFFQRALNEHDLVKIAEGKPPEEGIVAFWGEFDHDDDRFIDLTGDAHHAEWEEVEIVEGEFDDEDEHEEYDDDENEDDDEDGTEGAVSAAALFGPAYEYTACGVAGAPEGMNWKVDDDAEVRLLIPARDETIRFTVWYTPVDEPADWADVRNAASQRELLTPKLSSWTDGGPQQWNAQLKTIAENRTAEKEVYLVERLPLPTANPYGSRLRPTGLDFFADGRSAAICTLAGDVWIVDGLGDDVLNELKWQRIAAGLYQPLGLRIVNKHIYVTCRDQIVRLRDLNGDGETDFYECFNDDAQVTPHIGEFAFDLETDNQGNLYYGKATPDNSEAIVPQHGSVLRVATDGSATHTFATGFQIPAGLDIRSDGAMYAIDQTGTWTPANKISIVRDGGFYGNMHTIGRAAVAGDYQIPVTWVDPEVDSFPADIVQVSGAKWGPLADKLLCLSGSSGAIHVVISQAVKGVEQGGVFRLPVNPLPTSIRSGRFNRRDGQLYVCGWSDNEESAEPGGLYRIRFTGRPHPLPIELNANRSGFSITFSEPLDPASASDWRSYSASRWSYRRTAQFGSDDYRVSDPRRRGRDRLRVLGVGLSADHRTVTLRFNEMRTADQMQIKCAVKSASGVNVDYTIHHTIHALGDD